MTSRTTSTRRLVFSSSSVSFFSSFSAVYFCSPPRFPCTVLRDFLIFHSLCDSVQIFVVVVVLHFLTLSRFFSCFFFPIFFLCAFLTCSYGYRLVILVFLPQRAPLAPLWALTSNLKNTFHFLPASLSPFSFFSRRKAFIFHFFLWWAFF